MHAYCKFKPPSCQKSTTTTKPSQFPKPTCSWSPRAAGLGKLTSHNLPSTKISCISSQFLIQPLPFQSQYWMVWPLANRMNTSHVCQFHAQNDPCYLLEIESKMFEITGCVGVLKLRNVSPILDRFLPVTLLTLPLYGLHPRRHEWPQCLTGFQKFRGILFHSTYVTSMKNMNESKLIHKKY